MSLLNSSQFNPMNSNPLPKTSKTILRDIEGFFRTVVISPVVAPTYKPKSVANQIEIRVNSATSPTVKKIYYYAFELGIWIEIAGQDLSGYVPTSRTINGYPLSANISLTAADLGVSNIILGRVASNNLRESLDAARDVNGNSSGAPKSIKIYKSGTVRLKVEYCANTGFTGNTVLIRRNGVTLQSIALNMTSYAMTTIDIDVSFGDVIDFYVNYYGTINAHCYVRNFRLYYDDVILTEIPDVTIADTNL